MDRICMARPAGFEPTTPWFVARYAIVILCVNYVLI